VKHRIVRPRRIVTRQGPWKIPTVTGFPDAKATPFTIAELIARPPAQGKTA
jgi:hypothetical protein